VKISSISSVGCLGEVILRIFIIGFRVEIAQEADAHPGTAEGCVLDNSTLYPKAENSKIWLECKPPDFNNYSIVGIVSHGTFSMGAEQNQQKHQEMTRRTMRAIPESEELLQQTNELPEYSKPLSPVRIKRPDYRISQSLDRARSFGQGFEVRSSAAAG
jgi:hypothetical protein